MNRTEDQKFGFCSVFCNSVGTSETEEDQVRGIKKSYIPLALYCKVWYNSSSGGGASLQTCKHKQASTHTHTHTHHTHNNNISTHTSVRKDKSTCKTKHLSTLSQAQAQEVVQHTTSKHKTQASKQERFCKTRHTRHLQKHTSIATSCKHTTTMMILHKSCKR